MVTETLTGLEVKLISLIPLAVIAEGLVSGFVTLALNIALQLLPPEMMVQETGLGVRVPDIVPPIPVPHFVPSQTVPGVQVALTNRPVPAGEVGTSDLALL